MRYKIFYFIMMVPNLVCCGLTTTSKPVSQPTTTQAAVEVSPQVDAILTRQEKTGQAIKDLRATISDEIYQVIPDDRQTKFGVLRYRAATGGKEGRFMIFFDTLVQEDLKLRQKQWLCFNGRWLREINEQTKTAIDREVVEPGEKIDPYKLGEGFFPIPFGQKKADILKNFNVTLAKSEKSDPPGSDHLVLTPKPASPFVKRYKKVEFWIDAKTNLPLRVISRDTHSIITTVNFKDTKINAGIPDNQLWIDVPAGYGYQREPLEGRE